MTLPTSHYLKRMLRNRVCRAIIRPLLRWQPLRDPVEGYSLVLACPAVLIDLLGASFRTLNHLDRTHLDRVFVVIDQPLTPKLAATEQQWRYRYPDLPIEFLHFNRPQTLVMDALRWSWTYCWLSWALGVARCRSRYLMIHDLDLLPLAPDFLEKRYATIVELGAHWLGMDRYAFNGFVPADNLMASNELLLDAVFLRDRFKPIDLFNHVTRHHGRKVEFDLTCDVQHRAGRAAHLGYRVMEMVHPNQMICQYMALRNQPNFTPHARSSLVLLPYYLHLADQPEALRRWTAQLPEARSPQVTLLDRNLDLSRLSAQHVRILAEMAFQVERALFQHVRPEITAYFHALESFAPGNDSALPPLPPGEGGVRAASTTPQPPSRQAA